VIEIATTTTTTTTTTKNKNKILYKRRVNLQHTPAHDDRLTTGVILVFCIFYFSRKTQRKNTYIIIQIHLNLTSPSQPDIQPNNHHMEI
jgi:hypothetical protein